MKTITEFFGPSLLSALTKDKELAASGKTAEELPAAREQLMTELTKFEGDKLKHFLAALDAVGNKADRLKRVVVWQVAEGEKGPKAALMREGFSYIVEYFANPHQNAKPSESRDDDRRGGRRDRKGGRGGKGGRGPGQGGERRDGDRRPVERKEGEQRELAPRQERKPRGPGPVGVAASGKPLPKPRKDTENSAPQS
jgi:hypothetical protein